MIDLKFIVAILFTFTFKVQAEKCVIAYKNEEGECVFLHACPLLFEIANLGPQGEELIQKSICGGTKFSPKVCCDLSTNITQPEKKIVTLNKNEDVKAILLPSRQFCGYQHSDDYLRDENDTSVRINEFPWLAHLLYKDKNTGEEDFLCAGSLINTRYILTAAQCINNTGQKELIGVRLGEYYYTNQSDCVKEPLIGQECSDVENHGIEKIITHPNFDHMLNDIGLIRLNSRIVYSDFIRPICLPQAETSAKVGDTLISSGWGYSSSTGRRNELKKKSFNRMISQEDCAWAYRAIDNITENHICTVLSRKNRDFQCFDDSGGPVIFSQDSFQWQQEGIISYIFPECGIIPDVSTKVVNYLTWIEDNLEA